MDDSRTGKVLQGRYKIAGPLAEGGMGVVYRAERLGIGRPVVVKFLHAVLTDRPGVVDRFEREARATARLNHPNCVALVDYGIEDNAPFLVMEYVEGQTLADLLDHGALLPPRAVRITSQVLAGLSHAHERGILHRDLKPANVMIIDAVGWNDMVKILDFGLAKLLNTRLEDQGKREVTVEGIAIGTPGYMSPEQAAGVPSDRRSDVYCAGALLYHLVTGTKAFAGSDVHEVLRRHREETPAAPRVLTPGANISAELEEVIRHAMQREPGKRYQSADEMAEALRETPEARVAPPSPVPLPGVRPPRKEPDSQTHAETPSSRARATPRKSGGGGGLFLLGAILGAAGIVAAVRYTDFGAQVLLAGKETGATENGSKIAPPTVEPKITKKETDSNVKVADSKPDLAVNAKEAADLAEAVVLPKIEPRPLAPPDGGAEPDDETLAKLDDGAGEDDRSPPPEAAGAPHREVSVRHLSDVRALIKKGDADGALAGLYRLRRAKPAPNAQRSSEIAALIGHLYFDRKWWTDALREYRFAVTVYPRARTNSILVGNAVHALSDRATFARARRLVANYLGRAALPALRKAARSGATPALRRRAAALVAALDRKR